MLRTAAFTYGPLTRLSKAIFASTCPGLVRTGQTYMYIYMYTYMRRLQRHLHLQLQHFESSRLLLVSLYIMGAQLTPTTWYPSTLAYPFIQRGILGLPGSRGPLGVQNYMAVSTPIYGPSCYHASSLASFASRALDS